MAPTTKPFVALVPRLDLSTPRQNALCTVLCGEQIVLTNPIDGTLRPLLTRHNMGKCCLICSQQPSTPQICGHLIMAEWPAVCRINSKQLLGTEAIQQMPSLANEA
mmetsp:Transcript_46818/g.90323  ORF Transcript_46818/g.90323 Transcript_46818/m.90323 type:complete len:106 (-) Transcript_46818:177-494(-)